MKKTVAQVLPQRKRAAPKPAPRAGGPSRPVQRRNPEKLQSSILEAASAEFAEFGFAGARIENISASAKTADRMLYYYFGNKERLYEAVLENMYRGVVEAQEKFVVDDKDPVAGMRDLISATWNHYVSHPQTLRLLMDENLMRGRHLAGSESEYLRTIPSPLLSRVEKLLETGSARGVFRSDVPSIHVLMTIMALGFFYLSNHYTCSQWLRTDLVGQDRLDRWRDHMIDTVFRLLAPTPQLGAVRRRA